MLEKIITIYCFLDEILKALQVRDDPQAKLSTAEVLTVALVAAEFFAGNQQASLDFLVGHRYLPAFSKCRFNRRFHAVPEGLWKLILWTLAKTRQQLDADLAQGGAQLVHVVDTFPVPVCRNIGIRSCRIYRHKAFQGHCASKREYFHGLKVCLIVTDQGAPVEMLLAPGSTADVAALRSMDLDLPEGSVLIGDGGFLDPDFEASVLEEAHLRLVVPRRSNMKEQLEGSLAYVCSGYRKRVETSFSLLCERMARSIHAVTPRGFELKVFLRVLVFSILG